MAGERFPSGWENRLLLPTNERQDYKVFKIIRNPFWKTSHSPGGWHLGRPSFQGHVTGRQDSLAIVGNLSTGRKPCMKMLSLQVRGFCNRPGTCLIKSVLIILKMTSCLRTQLAQLLQIMMTTMMCAPFSNIYSSTLVSYSNVGFAPYKQMLLINNCYFRNKL
jgi:hypothetical protein